MSLPPTIPPSLAELLKDPSHPIHNANAVRAELERRRLDTAKRELDSFKDDPLGFTYWAWQWGEGPLAHSPGPDENQKKFLEDLGEECKKRNFNGYTPVAPVMMSISSAHGTGKSTMGAWVGWWLLSTRPNSIGTVTAGTYQQLEERTWSEMVHWGRMCRTGDQFDIQNSGIYHKDPRLRWHWKVTPKTAKRENAHAFAGQHAATSTSWFLFDEASEVPDENWYESYGGLTDGAPVFVAFGQMLRNTGEFYNVTFGEASKNWNTRVWDGRNSAFTNKELIAAWIQEWGDESDFVRVRVAGLPPRASELQFITQSLVDDARRRDHRPLADEPLVVGFDAANGGQARFVFAFRRGLDAKSIQPIVLPGDTHRDIVVAKAAEILSDRRPSHRVSALFGDQAFGAVILERLRNSGYTNVFEVNFGAPSPSPKYLNNRSFMWSELKEWLNMGSIPDSEKLAQQFFGPGFHHTSGKLVLESKEQMARRKVKSPDYVDALACTFFRRIAAPPPRVPQVAPRGSSGGGGTMSWVR